VGLIKNILINPSLPRLIKQTGFKICSCIPEISSTTATFFYITWHCFTSRYSCQLNKHHTNNRYQITVMVFSLYKKEITIHSYNETNYEVKTRKLLKTELWMQNVEFWNVNEYSHHICLCHSYFCTNNSAFEVHFATTQQLSDINRYEDVFCCMCCHYMVQ